MGLCSGDALSLDCTDLGKNGDGDAVVGDALKAVYTFTNDGDGSYTRNFIQNRPTKVNALAFADIDHDGTRISPWPRSP